MPSETVSAKIRKEDNDLLARLAAEDNSNKQNTLGAALMIFKDLPRDARRTAQRKQHRLHPSRRPLRVGRGNRKLPEKLSA